jgi:serine/threonine-protein kinase
VQVTDCGRDSKGRPFLVMEFVDGANLRELLRASWRSGPPHQRLLAHVFALAAQGLAAAHATVDPKTRVPLNLVHRDVSPDNILLSRYGAVKVADFGVARAMQEAPVTSPDVVRGKLPYMSPELLKNQPLTAAADQWALGVAMFEALSGRRPFDAANEGAVMYAIVDGTRPRLEVLAPDCDARLVAIIDRCLSVNPAERFASCGVLADALNDFVHASGLPLSAAVLGAWVESLSPSAPLLPEVLPASQPSAPLPPELVARFSPEPRHAPTPSPAPAPLPAAPPVDDVQDLEPRARRRFPVVPLLLVALVLGLVGAVLGLRAHRAATATQQLLVTVKQPNAKVLIDGLEVGDAPWAGDIANATGHTLEVKAPGYATWSTTLDAGVGGTVEVSLKRR